MVNSHWLVGGGLTGTNTKLGLKPQVVYIPLGKFAVSDQLIDNLGQGLLVKFAVSCPDEEVSVGVVVASLSCSVSFSTQRGV